MKASEVATKWNTRYLEESEKYNAPVRKLLLDYTHLLPSAGNVLEIAGGFGVSADFLQKYGLQVIELDISWQALIKAKKKNAGVFHITADANRFPFGDIKFDVICNFYFFERSLVPRLIHQLKPGGVIFFETLTTAMLSVRPEIPPEYLLLPGELKEAFRDLEIIHYFEGWTKSDHAKQKSIGSLVARKPKTSV
jgi:SAM-dependent methyltransferase